jgi:hypothetical protein
MRYRELDKRVVTGSPSHTRYRPCFLSRKTDENATRLSFLKRAVQSRTESTRDHLVRTRYCEGALRFVRADTPVTGAID